MFGWFKNDYDKRVEEANNEFVRLYGENQDLKRENRLLKQANERHREALEYFYSGANRFPKGATVWLKPEEGYLANSSYRWKKPIDQEKPDLLEIKLKDTDSVPEVWYEGRRLDELPNGLVSIDYNWKTKGHDGCFEGENNLDIEWFGTHKEGFRR